MKRIISVIILTVAGSLCLFAQNSSVILPEKPNRPQYIDYSTLEKGFFCAVQFSPALTLGSDGNSMIYQADVVAGYRLSEYLRIGAGISPRFNQIKNLPIYLDLRGNFVSQASRMCVPYWSVDIGYATNQGFYASPTVGARFGGIRHNFLAGIGYICQCVRAENTAGAAINCIALRLGYEF